MMRRLWTVFVCLLLVSCDKPKPIESVYPTRPVERPYFLNTSSIQSVNEVAIGDLKRARELTGIDFTMAFVSELPDGISTENYAAELYTRWKIGSATGDKGLLFLFVESEGVLKIEVGYQLEGVFPDGFVGSFQDSLKHYFAGRYFGDVVSGMITAMVQRAQQQDMNAILSEFQESLPPPEATALRYHSGGAGIVESGFFYEKDTKLKLIRELDPQARARFSSHEDPREVIRSYLESLRQAINDPYLDLLTEGSQYMRMEYPKSAGFQRKAAREYSGEPDVTIEGNLAVAKFKNPTAIPLLLRREADGRWRIDVTKSWAYCQASSDLKTMNPAFADHPWMFAWPEGLRHPEYPATPPPLPAGFKIADEIAKLETEIKADPKISKNYFLLADLLYFECYWIRGAMDALERGLAEDPTNSAYRKRLIKLSYRFPDLSKVQEHYETLLKYDPNDLRTIKDYIWFLKTYRNDPGKIAALKARLENLSISKTPFYLDAAAAHQNRYHFAIPRDLRSIQVEVRPLTQNWHPKWLPAVQVFLTNGARSEQFGLQIQFETQGGAGELSQINTLGKDAAPQSLSVGKIPNNQSRLFTLRWNDQRDAVIELDGRIVAEARLPFDPVTLVTFTRSGDAAFTIK